MTANDIAQQLALQVENICVLLLPNGKKEGNHWCAGSINGEAGKSLKVCLTGDKKGVWSDFNGGNDKGDLLDLWAAVVRISLGDAIKEAKKYLGIYNPKFHQYTKKQFTKPKVESIELKPNSQVFKYLTIKRKLNTTTLETFKVSEQSNQIVFNFYRNHELILRKKQNLIRENGKKKIFADSNCEPCLYGWDTLPSNIRSITLTEGEIDAMSYYQYGYYALSVPYGGGSGDKQKWLEYEYERLEVFDIIYLSFDPDESGDAAVSELIERLGRHRCLIIKLPKKDINECLMAGITKEIIQKCYDEAISLDPEELKPANEYLDEVINEFYPDPNIPTGYTAPWNKTKDKIAFRFEELSIWTGINGHGKSQFLNQIVLACMLQGAKVCIASLEIKPAKTLMKLTRQSTARRQPSIDYINQALHWYDGNLWLFDLVGNAKSKRLIEVFIYARQRYGIDVFIIDSFMKLDIAEDDYKAQKNFIDKLCDFKNEYKCHVHLVVHPKKSQDESQPPGKMDNKGTGAITDLADNCYTVWRNKNKEKIKQLHDNNEPLTNKELEVLKQADCFWCCDKQRNGEWEGKFGFWFDKESLQYIENNNSPPTPMINYCSNDKPAVFIEDTIDEKTN